jgi:hypothetical protein
MTHGMWSFITMSTGLHDPTECEALLPCLQDYMTIPLVPIFTQMNLVHTTPSYFSKIHLNIILQPTSFVIVVPLLLTFSPNLCTHSCSPVRTTCPVHPILLDLIVLIMFGETTSYGAPHLSIMLTNPLSFHPPRFKHLHHHSTSYSQTPSVYVVTLMSELNFYNHTKLRANIKSWKKTNSMLMR